MEIGRSDITRRRRENDDLDEDKARRARHNRATGGRFGDLSGGRGSMDGSGGEKDEDAARRANERFRALASQIRVTQVRKRVEVCGRFWRDFFCVLLLMLLTACCPAVVVVVVVVVTAVATFETGLNGVRHAFMPCLMAISLVKYHSVLRQGTKRTQPF